MRFDQPKVATAQVLGIDEKLQFANIADTKARADVVRQHEQRHARIVYRASFLRRFEVTQYLVLNPGALLWYDTQFVHRFREVASSLLARHGQAHEWNIVSANA